MILVFAGAGASAAVNPENYPTTVEFFRRLPAEVVKDPFVAQAKDFLGQNKSQDEAIDIERILWQLDDLGDLLDKVGDPETFIGHAFLGNRLTKRIGGPDTNILAAQAPTLLKDVRRTRDRIYQQVYELYRSVPTKGEIGETWGPLLSALLTRQHNVQLFTTNYDQVIEEAIDVVLDAGSDLPRIQTALQGRQHRPTLDVSRWRHPGRFSAPGGMLTKLHGSIDWSWDGDEISAGNPIFKGTHSKHVIVYPGYKSNTTPEPFRSFHQYFEQAIREAEAMLFIGYAFRDDYINELLRRNRRSGIACVVVNPARELPGIPWSAGSYVHLTEEFAGNLIHNRSIASILEGRHVPEEAGKKRGAKKNRPLSAPTP